MTYMADNRKWFTQSVLGHWFTVSMLGHWFTVPSVTKEFTKEFPLVAAHTCIPSSLEAEQEDHEFKSSLVHTVSI